MSDEIILRDRNYNSRPLKIRAIRGFNKKFYCGDLRNGEIGDGSPFICEYLRFDEYTENQNNERIGATHYCAKYKEFLTDGSFEPEYEDAKFDKEKCAEDCPYRFYDGKYCGLGSVHFGTNIYFAEIIDGERIAECYKEYNNKNIKVCKKCKKKLKKEV